MPNEDFEDLKREFRARIERFRGGSGRNLGPGAAIVVGVIIAVAIATTCFYTVEADEVGVVLRLGRYYDTTQPGLHFKVPLFVDNVERVKVNRVHKEEFGFRTVSAGVRTLYSKDEDFDNESVMLTADRGIADVEWIVQYRISDPRAFLFGIKDVRETLRDVSEYVIRREVGDSSIDEVITSRRRTIADQAKLHMQEVLDELFAAADLNDEYETGIEIVTVELQNVNPPKKVRDSFNDVNRAIQEKQTRINEAYRLWNTEIPTTSGRATQQVETAEGYKVRRVKEAEGDVARYSALLAEYTKAKEVTRARLYIEALDEVLPKISQIYVVDGATGAPLKVLDLKNATAAGAARKALRKDERGR